MSNGPDISTITTAPEPSSDLTVLDGLSTGGIPTAMTEYWIDRVQKAIERAIP